MNRADGWDRRKMSFHTASRCSQRWRNRVPLTRFTPHVGGGSTFYVRSCSHIYESYHRLYSILSVSFRCGHQRYSSRHLVIQGLAGRFIGHGGGVYTRRSDQSSSPNSHEGWSCIVSLAELLSQRSRSGCLFVRDRKRHKYHDRFWAGRTLFSHFCVRFFQ